MAAIEFRNQAGEAAARPVVDPGIVTAAVAALVSGGPTEFGVLVLFDRAIKVQVPGFVRFGYAVTAADGTILQPPAEGHTFATDARIFASARLDLARAEAEAPEAKVAMVLDALGKMSAEGWRLELAEKVSAELDRSVPAARARPADLPPLPEPAAAAGGSGGAPPDGQNVLIGVVDFGCDFAHPAFLTDGGQTRLRLLWDQNAKGPRGTAKPGLPGRFFTEAEIGPALVAADDPYAALGYDPEANAYAPSTVVPGEPVHGTHVLGVAAGRGVPGCPAGVAPGAQLAFVHLRPGALVSDGDAVDVFDGVCSVFDRADVLGVPAIVNLSVGANSGPHDGNTIFDRALDAVLGKAERAITVAAGNAREQHRHATGAVRRGAPTVLDWRFGEGDPTPNVLRIFCAAAGEDPPLRCAVIDPDDRRTELGGGAGRGADILLGQEKKQMIGMVYTGLAPPADKAPIQHIEVRLAPTRKDGETWRVELSLAENGLEQVTFDAWVDRDDRQLEAQSAFVPKPGDADRGCSLSSVACGRRPICVGAYDATTPGLDPAGFSSAGPTLDRRPKPDVVAPGVEVRAAFARGGRRASGQSVHINPMRGRMSGTSVAAPHVAGVVALMLQAHRALDAERILRGLRATTQVLPATQALEGAAEPRSWSPRLGCGRVDAAAAVRWALQERNR